MSIPKLTLTESVNNKLFEISSTMPSAWEINEKDFSKNIVNVVTARGAVDSLMVLIDQCPPEDQAKLLTTLKKVQSKLEFNKEITNWLDLFSKTKQTEYENGLTWSAKTYHLLESTKMDDPRLKRIREKLSKIFTPLIGPNFNCEQIRQVQWKDHPESMHTIMRQCEHLAAFSEHVVRNVYRISFLHESLQKNLKDCLKTMVSLFGPHVCQPLLHPPRMNAAPFQSCSQSALLKLYKKNYSERALEVLEMGRQNASIRFLLHALDQRSCQNNPINFAFNPNRLFHLIREAHESTARFDDDYLLGEYSFFEDYLQCNFIHLPQLGYYGCSYYSWLPPLPSEERMAATLTALIYSKNQSGFQRQGAFIFFGEKDNTTEDNTENNFKISILKKTSEHLTLCIDEEDIIYLLNPYGEKKQTPFLQEEEQQPELVILGDDPTSAAKYLCRVIRDLHRVDHKCLTIAPWCDRNTCHDIMSIITKDYRGNREIVNEQSSAGEYYIFEISSRSLRWAMRTSIYHNEIMKDANPVLQLDLIPPVPKYRRPPVPSIEGVEKENSVSSSSLEEIAHNSPQAIEIRALYQLKPTQNLGICSDPEWDRSPTSFTSCDGAWKGKIPLNKEWKFIILENGKVTHWEKGKNRFCKESTQSFTVQSHEIKF